MKKRTLLTAVVAASFAFNAAAAVSAKLRDWARGPVQFLMTKDEAAKWKSLTTDAEAEAFIRLFWARRDPTPATPENEYQQLFNQRVEYADKNLSAGERVPGSLTDRGKTLLLYGLPKRIVRSGYEKRPNLSERDRDLQENQRESEDWIQWIYEENDEWRDVFGVPRAEVRFVDRFGMNEYKVERGTLDLAAAQQRAIARAIKQPDLTEAPVFAASSAAAPAPAAATTTFALGTSTSTPPAKQELTTESLKTAIAEFKSASKNPYEKQTHAAWGEYVTADGTYFVPVMLYVPKTSGIAPADNLTFFGVVQDGSGQEVSSFEVPAKLTASKDDFFVDRSLTGLPAGKHRGYFGLAQNGKPLTLVAADMQLSGSIDKNAPAVSQLILSNNLFPLETAQRADDPYAFGGLKVVPKADHTFRPADELWYFFELRNPGIPEAATAEVVPITGTAPATPRVQLKIDVEGANKKMTAPPRETEAIPIKGVPGHYGVGSAIPLSTFKPGDYKLTIKVIDTVKKASYTLSDTFRVVE